LDDNADFDRAVAGGVEDKIIFVWDKGIVTHVLVPSLWKCL
jgi:hypothetical protein